VLGALLGAMILWSPEGLLPALAKRWPAPRPRPLSDA
jgi:hypothetical protein